MGAGRERTLDLEVEGDGRGARVAHQVGPAGAAARGQATEILAAQTAQVLRSRVRASAQANGEAFASEAAAATPPVSPVLGGSVFGREARLRGQADVLDGWASDYDAAHTPTVAYARQLGVLAALGRRGVDWRRPQAHRVEIQGMLDLAAAPAVSAAKASVDRRGPAGAFALWQAARRDVHAARAGVRSAAQMAQRVLTAQRAFKTQGAIDGLQRQQAQEDAAVDALKAIVDLGLGGKPTGVAGGVKAALGLVAQVGLLKDATRRHRAELGALKAQLARLKAASEDHLVQSAQAGLVEATQAFHAAVERLEAAEAELRAAQAQRAAEMAHLGTAIDEQRAPGAGPADPSTDSHASDRGTVLMGTAAAVELAWQAAEATYALLQDRAGPALVEAILNDPTRFLAGGHFDAAMWSPERPANRRVGEAAAHHETRRAALQGGRPSLKAASEGWKAAVAPLTES